MLASDWSTRDHVITVDKSGAPVSPFYSQQFSRRYLAATGSRAVTLHACGDEILVPGDKDEVFVHKLLADFLFHADQREVLSGKIFLQFSDSLLD